MKTAELEGAALDAAVAMVEGKTFERATARTAFGCDVGAPIIGFERDGPIVFRPSTDWSIGGPILARENIATAEFDGVWHAMLRTNMMRGDRYIDAYSEDWDASGPTPLIAAMRAFVASRLGDDVELPCQP